jgi:hypothetical protein
MGESYQCPICPKSVGGYPSTDTWGWSFPLTFYKVELKIDTDRENTSDVYKGIALLLWIDVN